MNTILASYLLAGMAFLSGSSTPLAMVGGSPAPDDPALLSIAPEQCQVFASWNGIVPADAKSENRTQKLLADPEVREYAAALRKMLQKFQQKVTTAELLDLETEGKQFGVEIPDLTELLISSGAVFMQPEKTDAETLERVKMIDELLRSEEDTMMMLPTTRDIGGIVRLPSEEAAKAWMEFGQKMAEQLKKNSEDASKLQPAELLWKRQQFNVATVEQTTINGIPFCKVSTEFVVYKKDKLDELYNERRKQIRLQRENNGTKDLYNTLENDRHLSDSMRKRVLEEIERIEKRAAEAESDADKKEKVDTEKAVTIEVKQLRTPMATYYFGVNKNYLLVGSSEEVIKGMLTRQKAGKVAQWLTDARAKCGVERLGSFVHVNTKNVLPTLLKKAIEDIDKQVANWEKLGIKNAADMPFGRLHEEIFRKDNPDYRGSYYRHNDPFDLITPNQMKKLLPVLAEASDLDKIDSVTLASGLKGEAMTTRHIVSTSKAPTGLLSLCSGAGITAEDLTIVPKNAMAALAFRLDLEKTYKLVCEIATKFDPKYGKLIEEQVKQGLRFAALTPEGDIFPTLGENVIVYLDPAEAGYTGVVLAIELKDAKKFQNILDRLQPMGAAILENETKQTRSRGRRNAHRAEAYELVEEPMGVTEGTSDSVIEIDDTDIADPPAEQEGTMGLNDLQEEKESLDRNINDLQEELDTLKLELAKEEQVRLHIKSALETRELEQRKAMKATPPAPAVEGTDDQSLFIPAVDDERFLTQVAVAENSDPDVITVSAKILTTEYRGRKISHIQIPDHDGGVSPAWCVTDKHLLVALYPQAIKAILERGEKFESLAKRQPLADDLAAKKTTQMLVWFDEQKAFRRAYPLALMLGKVLNDEEFQRYGVPYPTEYFPSSTAVMDKLGDNTTTFSYEAGTGFVLESRYTIPGVSPLTAVAPIGTGVFISESSWEASYKAEAQTRKRMQMLAQAMLDYQKEKGHFPTAFTKTKDGKPGLSWRVAILPYLGEKAKTLHKKFALDEAWDSPTNKPLLAEMPGVFRAPQSENPRTEYKTAFQVAVGENTAFTKDLKKFTPEDVVDDVKWTASFFEASDASEVPWTSPQDLDAEPLKKDIEQVVTFSGVSKMLRGPKGRRSRWSSSEYEFAMLDGTLVEFEAYSWRDNAANAFPALLTPAGKEEEDIFQHFVRRRNRDDYDYGMIRNVADSLDDSQYLKNVTVEIKEVKTIEEFKK